MAITGTSTAAEIRSEYLNNMGYEAANSLGMAQAFLAACMAMLLVRPSMSAQDRGSTQWDNKLIDTQIERVRLWIAMNPAAAGGGGVRHFSFENFRGVGGCADPALDTTDQGGG